MLGWSRAIVASGLTQCPKRGARPATTPTYVYITYIYPGRQPGSGARDKRQSWRGSGCADWSGHGGGAGRERLPRLGHLCVCVCMGAWVLLEVCVGSEGGI